MDKKVISFGDVEVEKRKFNRYKNLTFLNDKHIANILVTNRI